MSISPLLRQAFILSIFTALVSSSLVSISAKEYLILPESKEVFMKNIESIAKKNVYLENSAEKKITLLVSDIEKVLNIEEIPGIKIGSDFIQIADPDLATEKFVKLSIKEDTDILSSLLGDQKDSFSKSAENITIKKDQKTNKYIIEGKLLDGYEIDKDLFESMLLQIFQKDKNIRAVKVPENFTKAQILQDGNPEHSLELVTQGISDFKGSTTARIHNITTAYAHFEGAVIEPDAVFSFNDVLGPVDGSTGYAKELVIKGPKTVPDWGGGVCQVSSTVFRAALNAGLPIVERRNHSYAVSYYEPWGTDATIYPGVQDLKFKNDTGNPIIMHIYHEGTKLYVNFYGKKDGRQVQLDGPTIYDRRGTPSPTVETTSALPTGKQVLKEYGHPGFSAYWIRTVTKASGEKVTSKFNSIYEARPGYVLRGA